MQVTGPLTLETAREAVMVELPVGQDVSIIDLAGVTAVDSSALGVLMHWSRQYPGKLSFTNVPDSLHSLADLYDVSGMLPITAAGQTSL